MDAIRSCVVVVGTLVLWAGAARGDENAAADTKVTATPRKLAYVTPNGDPSGDPAPVQTWHPKEDDDASALDVFRIGAFGGIGFPRPLSVEGFAKIAKVVGLGVEYSVLPSVSLGGVETTFWALSGDLRVFPLQNGFFIGMTGGRQHVSATALVSLPDGYPSQSEQILGDTWFINPRIGFLSTSSWGLTIGIDIPIASDANSTAHYLAKSVLPTVDLLRVGLLF
jgi:hypothetical protein